MIKEIEIWDFESHEHTLISGISPDLNLFVGESNSGKTSIIRALKLVAYNEFDTKSVRLGAKKCVVRVVTDKGTVKVTRGPKDNLWEVTKNGCQTQYFDKVGVNIVPDVAEVIGLNIVNLGDVQIPVNIMDQLESHFMLAGVGNKDASGSMRAQIVDEISGLSGIEGLVKDVGLDHHRYGREITDTEKKMEEVRKQLHPESELNAEEDVLSRAKKEIDDNAVLSASAKEGEDLFQQWVAFSNNREYKQAQLDSIPNADLALLQMRVCDANRDKIERAEKLIVDCDNARHKQQGIIRALSVIPDFKTATDYIRMFEERSDVMLAAEEVLRKITSSMRTRETRLIRLQEIETTSQCRDDLDRASQTIGKISSAEDALALLRNLTKKRLMLHRMLEDKENDLNVAEKERDDILASVKTCPLTLKPVSTECLKGAIV